MLQNLLEKLQLSEEKNLLIQGLPSSIEKQFVKLAFAKNVTPLLKSRKIDFALVFAVSHYQLRSILGEVIPALHENAKFWIAYPKTTSKIATDLNRECSWDCMRTVGFDSVNEIALDHVWTAVRFQKAAVVKSLARMSNTMYATNTGINIQTNVVPTPDQFEKELRRSKVAHRFFEALSHSHQKEYVSWITNAKREDTRSRRMEVAIDKLIAGKRTPAEK
ncbi:MAG: YdeI/OmpD-associated family protein [Chitinophagaceae bacterium]|nr:YdeI/OmpD-associated family protein [Chitinophagaceae bacterium]